MASPGLEETDKMTYCHEPSVAVAALVITTLTEKVSNTHLEGERCIYNTKNNILGN